MRLMGMRMSFDAHQKRGSSSADQRRGVRRLPPFSHPPAMQPYHPRFESTSPLLPSHLETTPGLWESRFVLLKAGVKFGIIKRYRGLSGEVSFKDIYNQCKGCDYGLVP